MGLASIEDCRHELTIWAVEFVAGVLIVGAFYISQLQLQKMRARSLEEMQA